MRNIIVTMALGGLWHGANWTFVIWGLIHGVGIALSHAISFRLKPSKLTNALSVFFTFHFVAMAWVFFRAKNIAVALSILKAPFEGNWNDLTSILSNQVFTVVLIGVFFFTHYWDTQSRIRLLATKLPKPALIGLIVLAWILSITMSSGNSAEFIYFDF